MTATDTDALAAAIDAAFADPARATEPAVVAAVEEALDLLDRGEARVAERSGGEWVVNEWLKRAILLSFRQRRMATVEVGPFEYHDKIPLKHGFEEAGVRVVPPAVVRHGAFVERGAVLMPQLRQHRRLGGRGDHGRHLGDGRVVRADRRNVHLAGGVGTRGAGAARHPPRDRRGRRLHRALA